MENNLYLIHKEDYVKHIKEKAELFWMLKSIIKQILELHPNRDTKDLYMSALSTGHCVDHWYASCGIPRGFVLTGDADYLRELMENELIDPEDAGYCACDDTCCCGSCDLYDDDEDYDDYDEDEDETDVDDNFAELMAGLSSIAQSIFGDNVSVHIVVE